MIIEIKILSCLYAVIHIAKNSIEKSNYKNERHRVTLITTISHQNNKPIRRIFFSFRYFKVLATKCLWNVSFDVAHIRRKTKNKHDTLNFLSISHHRVTSSIFTVVFERLIRTSSNFTRFCRKPRHIFQWKNNFPRWSIHQEKLIILWPKRHRVTLVQADI